MKTMQKSLLLSFVLSLMWIAPAAAQPHGTITHTITRYEIRDELSSSYTVNDLKMSSKRLQDRTRSYLENARRQLNNLLPMQGKARQIVMNSKEQSAKLKDQQQVRNRIQRDRLSDLRLRNQELARQRADIKHKIRFDR